MKKTLALVLALVLCMSMLPTFASAEMTLAEKIADYKSRIGTFEEELVVTCVAPYASGDDHTIFDQVIKEKLNIVFDYTELSAANYEEQLNLMFATNDFPEIIYWYGYGAFMNSVKEWGTNGYLKAINEYAEAMPNYMGMFGETEWQNAIIFQGNYEGNLYAWPSSTYTGTNQCWIFRTDMIKELGMEVPTTTDELYEVMKAFKTKYPDAIPLLNRWGLGYLINGFSSAFHTSNDFWMNVHTNELEYGPTSQEYREMVVYLNKLYAEGLIDPEFLTSSDDQHKEYTATGRNIAEFSYSTRAKWANDLLAEGAVAGWEWTGNFLTAYPEKYEEGLVLRNPTAQQLGQIWTSTLQDEEKILRLAAWLDYASTPEGADISAQGIEGKTFYYDENGYARSNADQPDTYLSNSNVYVGPSYLTRYSHGWLIDNGKLTDVDLNAAVQGKPYYVKVAYAYDEDQETTMGTLSTQLNDVRDEWISKFIMGAANPSDDAQWNAYLDNLKTAGLEEALEINRATAIVGK